MTDKAVSEQVKTIKEATKKATKSKASAIKFLRDAGIIKRDLSKSKK